jgi:hypothetical protein
VTIVGGELSIGGPVGTASAADALAELAVEPLVLKPLCATTAINAATATSPNKTRTVRSRFAFFLSLEGGVGSSRSRRDDSSASRAAATRPDLAPPFERLDEDDDGLELGAPPSLGRDGDDEGTPAAPPRMDLRFCSLRCERVGFFATTAKLAR